MAQATGLTLLEQDFESALSAIPSGYGEGMHEGLRYGVTVRKPGDGKRRPACSRERSPAATSPASTFIG